MQTNLVKAALSSGGFAIGSEISRMAHRDVCRIYAQADLDFVFIDMEHTSFTLESVAALIEAARTHGLVPLVRVPEAEYSFVSRVLDAGARGIIVPRVTRPETVADVVSWTRYPPQGVRGYAATVAQTEGVSVDAAEFIRANQQQTLVVIQIERVEAMQHLDAMLEIDGVDVACLGYMDLTVDLGIPGQIDHPLAIEQIEQVIHTSRKHGVAPGIIAPDLAVVRQWMERGMRFVSYATETILLEQAVRSASSVLQTAAAGLTNGSAKRARNQTPTLPRHG